MFDTYRPHLSLAINTGFSILFGGGPGGGPDSDAVDIRDTPIAHYRPLIALAIMTAAAAEAAAAAAFRTPVALLEKVQ